MAHSLSHVMLAHCYRQFSTGPQFRGSGNNNLLRKYGLVAVGVYGTISLIELPILFGIVHYAGPDSLKAAEMKIRSAVGASTNESDSLIYKATKQKQGQLLTELGVAFLLHKALTILRLPATAAITPAVAKLVGRSGARNSSAPHAHIDRNPKALSNMGTPPNKRNKWLSWFF